MKGSKCIEFIPFSIATKRFMVEFLALERVVVNPPYTKIPQSPWWLEGVLYYNGEILPLIKCENKECLCERRIVLIIMQQNGDKVGLFADEIGQNLQIDIGGVEFVNDDELPWIYGKIDSHGNTIYLKF